MKLLRQLLEMSLGRFQHHGMEKKSGSFSSRDRKLLSRESYVKHVTKKFANTPYTFNLYFVNLSKYRPTETRYGKTSKRFTSEFAKYDKKVSSTEIKTLTGLDIEPRPDAITVVYISNADISSASMPMTPWIMAHRFAHTLTVTPQVKEIIEKMHQRHPYILPQWFTMRSARKLLGDIDSLEELTIEVVAQFIITGKVTLHHDIDRLSKKFETRLNAAVKTLLDSAVGGIWLAA